VRSSVDESGWSLCQFIDAVVGEKDCVTSGLGELLDTGSHIDGVADDFG
jgi:hypothetical protein